jgi:hypothetical protein
MSESTNEILRDGAGDVVPSKPKGHFSLSLWSGLKGNGAPEEMINYLEDYRRRIHDNM